MTAILITGITGSGASYLAEQAVEQPGVVVHGTVRWHSATHQANLGRVRERLQLHECDLLDFSSVLEVVRRVRPEIVFHLASHANVRASFATPLAVLNNNVMGTANLFEALRLEELRPRVLLCSTSEVYGQVAPGEVPIKEESPLRPVSPYAVSKAAQDLLGLAYHRSYGLPVIRTRMFTYINPRRADLFATSFALQIARIERGLQQELKHGNLESVRTFIDVRDAVDAYWVAAKLGEPGEVYNIGGTTTKSVGEFLEVLRKKSQVSFRSVTDPQLFRPADVTLQIPDTSRFTAATGWKPRFSFEESVEWLLEHCRREVARAG
jgi:GDP-4-dehydro-6-deoxy-D-mannose reductase